MRKYLAILLILLLAVPMFGQGTSGRIRFGATLPSTCTPLNGDVFFKTATTAGLYTCIAVNTWQLAGTGTVTSLGLSTNLGFITIGSSPITSSGTITVNGTTGLAANRVVATPNGSAGPVSIRTLVNADLPTVDAGHGGTGLSAVGTSGQCLVSNGTAWLASSCGVGGGGITTLNSLNDTVQGFAVGTSGSDFNISSSSPTHTFNIPSAGASARGLVSTGSQSFSGLKTFIDGLALSGGTSGTIQFQPQSIAGTYTFKFPNTDPVVGQNLSIASFGANTVTFGYANASTITGLTTNTIPKATSATTIGNSSVSDDGTQVYTTEKVGIGTATPTYQFDVNVSGDYAGRFLSSGVRSLVRVQSSTNNISFGTSNGGTPALFVVSDNNNAGLDMFRFLNGQQYQVATGATFQETWQVNSSTSAVSIGTGNGFSFWVYDNPNGLYRVLVNSTTGNVGINTQTTIASQLTVNGDIGIYGTGSFASQPMLISNQAPTVSGFGTSPSVPNQHGSAAFEINVGTGGTASTGTINFPSGSPAARVAATGWACHVQDVTNPDSFVTVQTGGTVSTVTLKNYSRTTGSAIAWTASDVLRCSCFAY